MTERQKGWVHVPTVEERLANEAQYGEQIRAWLLVKMPDVCRQDPKVIESHRRCFGDPEANRLAASTQPHPAAIAAVIRLHHGHGKGSLTVKGHGAEIRAAVKRANDQAIADYEAITSKRTKEE